VNRHAQFFSAASEEIYDSALKILAYLGSTMEVGLSLGGRNNQDIRAFVDSDFAGDEISRLSTTGNLIFVGDSLISWASKRQKLIATSSTEAEFLAVFYSLRDVQFIHQLVISAIPEQNSQIIIFQDNLSTIALISNESSKGRTKHFDIKLKAVGEALRNGEFTLQHLPTAEMLADALTKPLNRNLFSRMRQQFMTN
jgi:histone deacetylase 1/2